MTGRMALWRRTGGTLVAAGLVLGMMPQAVQAQQQEAERLQRIETQLRALQRAVFPGGDQRFFEPEIAAPQPGSPAAATPAVSASALTGVLARLEAIELQLARLTAATEVNENALALMDTRLALLEQGAVPEVPAPTAAAAPAATLAPAQVAAGAATATTAPARPAVQPVAQPAAPVASGPSAERLAAVQAILKPATADAGDDEYVYGFRLWDAGFYPEAQQQLALFLERYPGHSRATFARNLLGRAFLDAGEPRRAATHFFENYQSDKQAARAPTACSTLPKA
jgi:TolA-binding protein